MLNNKYLSKQQQEAILEEKNVLLTACPGSGKTRVLTYKIAHELEKIQETKKKIVALTFTNRAADEIKRRVVHMDISPDRLWEGTIHSFCLEWILRPYAPYLSELKNGFSIADEYKSEKLMEELKETYGYEWWTRITTRLDTKGRYVEPDIRYHDLLDDYHDTLEDEGLIDFDQILYYAYKLLDSFPKIAQTLSNLFHMICVDEYQDTQQLQYAILSRILTAENCKTKLFMVGDKDQAIYGSLGGIAKDLEDIKAEFNNIEIIELQLSGNYRSTQRIIDYYRNYQTESIEIESLVNYNSELGLITFNEQVKKDDLDEHIASIIQQNLDKGIPEHEICVLAPQWWLVIPMGRKLKKLLPEVNFDALGLSPLLKNKENIWFKIVRLFLVEPSPKMFFTRSKWANELIEELTQFGISIPEINNRKLLRIINLISSEEEEGIKYLEECCTAFLKNLDININDNPRLLQQWQHFFAGCRKRLENKDFDYAKDIKSFRRLFKNNEGVVVNTCHGIKGEEYHTVIAFGLLQGYIPNWNELNPEVAAQKLLYVICSRSKKHLHLISEKGRRTNNGRREYESTLKLKGVSYEYDTD